MDLSAGHYVMETFVPNEKLITMKKSLVLYAMIASCLCMMFGCNKADSLATENRPGKLEAILAMSGDDQLTAFNMLSGQEKVAIHELHINRYATRQIAILKVTFQRRFSI